MKFKVLIIGSDVNAYYMARCNHEAYKEKATLLVNKPLAFTTNSKILDIIYNENIWDENEFISAVNNFAEKYSDYKILVISSNETYVEMLVKNTDKFRKNIIFNYPSLKIIQSFINKKEFYNCYKDSGLNFPKSYYFNTKTDSKLDFNLKMPIILKPANVVMYNHIDFPSKKKIYKIYNNEELNQVILDIKRAGYEDDLVIQEYIDGDDSHLFDCVVYVDSKCKVKIQSFAQIGLQEYAPNMIGNAAVVINGINTFKASTNEICESIRNFMEKIGYRGFAEVDLKYDESDGKFKVLEINARQGRCSYYITQCGFNLVKCLVDDLIYNKPYDFEFLSEQVMLSFVDYSIIKKYVKNKEYKKFCKLLHKKSVNPLIYNVDNGLKRKLLLFYRKLRYHKSYFINKW